MLRNRTRRSLVAAAAMTALALSLAACGEDDAESAPTTAGDGSSIGTLAPDYCEGILAIDTMGPVGGPEAVDGAKAHFSSLIPVVDGMAAAAPGAVAPSLGVLRQAVADAASTGASPFMGPEAMTRTDVQLASAEVHGAAHEGCGFHAVEVKGVDYGFEGLGTTLTAGPTSIKFTNGSDRELHEIVLFRKNDGVTATTAELISQGDAAFASIEFVGGTMAPAGATTFFTADLAPGSYGVVCFIPVGSGAEGQPHAMHGMLADLTVAA